jgi:imidazolonepropionase-like amidohydrolase
MLVVITLCVSLAGCTGGSRALALVNGTLIDGTGAEPLPDAAVVIREGRIVVVGSRTSVTIPRGAKVIDVHGGTILPGFFNAHVHGSRDLAHLKVWAQAGVTTVRDLGDWPPEEVFAFRSKAAKDPHNARIAAAGPFITAPGGYPIAVFESQAITASTPDEARQAAERLLDQGADIIKIGLESGAIFTKWQLPMLSPEAVQAIVEVAHGRGTLVVAHLSVSKDLKLAIDLGVDDVAHMVTDLLPEELMAQMVARGMYWEPTLELWKGVGQGLDRLVVENLRRYVAAGGKVALGTDYEGYTTPFQLGMPTKEMGWMLEAGMTPMQVIVAATQNTAHVCNMAKDLGTLEAGKVADVLVVQGDPLEDIHALEKVGWVIHNGVVIKE